MAILLKVKWVEQTDHPVPYQRIRRIGGDTNEMEWQHTRAQAIEGIERGQFSYYLEKDALVLKLDVGQTADGHKYLTIQGNGGPPQALFTPPSFPSLPSTPPNPT